MASSSKKVIFAALIGNSLISITKFFASFVSGSSAMLSEGIHSLVDTGNQLLLLLGIRRSKRPPDKHFPFGHGKEIYFWSFIVAILIFAIGSGVSIYEGVHSLSDPRPVENPSINYIVLTLAMIFEGGAWYFAWKEFRRIQGERGYVETVRKEKDPTTFVVLFEDSAAILGLVVAFIGVALAHVTGNPIYDGIASVCIGGILGLTAVWLAYETKGLLIGESADETLVDGIHLLAKERPGILEVNEALTMHMGPDFVLVNISVNFKNQLDAKNIEKTVSQLSRESKERFPKVKRIFVEAEDWAERN